MFGNIFSKRSKISIERLGFLQAVGVALYCTLVGLFIWNGDNIFGTMSVFLAPVLMLILFSVSVLICGLSVFYLPYRLFFDKKRKEAADLVLYTTGWLAFFFLVFLLLIFII